jgi:hypothetical protein
MTDDSLHHDLQVLQNHRIYFGHQSVGFNIMEGLRDILKEHPDIRLTLLTLEKPVQLPESYFLDSRLGENTKPLTKCSAFLKTLDPAVTASLEVALMKFCYVDITAETDVRSLFRSYTETIDSLHRMYPHIRIVHVTTPLTAREGGIRGFIKRLLGRQDESQGDNIKRNQFNALLRTLYAQEPIFDLAAAESTYKDGSRESFERDGTTYYSLIGGYASDGAHLNPRGRKAAAAAMIRTLARVLQQPSPSVQ